MVASYRSIEWRDGVLRMLDQRRLPHELVYKDFTDCSEVAAAIRDMVVRGAPAIGVAAAYGLALASQGSTSTDPGSVYSEVKAAADVLQAARPTAVNLFWAIDRVLASASAYAQESAAALCQSVLDEAHAIAAEDVETNMRIGMNALPLIPDKATIIHHCNTGSLATMGYGTALGIIRTAHEHGKQLEVLVGETRPRLQGGQLTSWELKHLGVPLRVIVDGASGHFMRTERVDLCVVGADRVAANGDIANKIGTYNLALAAWAHGVPFYVAAPTTTFDMSLPTGDRIAIEERPAREITHVGDYRILPDDVSVANPAFDITPAKYITAIITERGIACPPFEENLAALVKGDG